MNEARFDVTAIGNAIVDVLAQADDSFLERLNLAKGTMSLIDAEDADRLYSLMGPGIEASGGSAANTIAVIAVLGASSQLGPEDVDESLIVSSEVLFLEGYLWDQERAKQAFLNAAQAASAGGRKVAFT